MEKTTNWLENKTTNLAKRKKLIIIQLVQILPKKGKQVAYY